MSDSAASSSDLSELQDGVGLRSDSGSNDSADDSEPETEAETERLEISPQKSRNNATAQDPDDAATLNAETGSQSMRPGLTAQDILGDHRPSSDADEDGEQTAPASPEPNERISPPELAGKKRKRSGSSSALANGQAVDGGPLKKRTSSTRYEKKAPEAAKSILASLRDRTEEAIADSSSADEGRDPTERATEGRPGLASESAKSQRRRDAADDGEQEGSKEDLADLSETAGDDDAQLNEPMDDEDGEADGDGEGEADADADGDGGGDGEGDGDGEEADAEAEAETTAKTEDELAKKRVAMDALVPIEKLFAIFRDRLFDEKWAQLSAELAVLNDPNTTHPDYLAMRQAIDARREEKIKLEHISLGYKTKALESKVLSHRAQIHGQYFQTLRKIREEYMDKLNEQFCQIQRERRQWKTKEPHFIYSYDPKRSKQIAYQTAYNKEVSLLSGIAKHVGFPAAPEIHGATSSDVEDDLRAMNIQPQPRPVSYSARMVNSARADEAAAEEQFLEKTPWANPQHPAHQHALGLDRKSLDPSRPSMATPSNRAVDMHRGLGASASTIGANSDPPSGFAQSQADTIVNGSSPFEQMKRRDVSGVAQQQQQPPPASNAADYGNVAAFAHNAGNVGAAADKGPLLQSQSNPPGESPYESSAIYSNRPPEAAANDPPFPSRHNARFGSPGPESQEISSNLAQDKPAQEPIRYQSPPLGSAAKAAAEQRFAAAPPEGVTASVGVARSYGVR